MPSEILDQGMLDEKHVLIRCFVDRIEADPETEKLEVFMCKIPVPAEME